MLKLVGKHYFEYNKKHKLKILKTIYYVEGTYIYICIYRLIIGSKITKTKVIINKPLIGVLIPILIGKVLVCLSGPNFNMHFRYFGIPTSIKIYQNHNWV